MHARNQTNRSLFDLGGMDAIMVDHQRVIHLKLRAIIAGKREGVFTWCGDFDQATDFGHEIVRWRSKITRIVEVDLIHLAIHIRCLIGRNLSQILDWSANIPNPQGKSGFVPWILDRIHHTQGHHYPHHQCHTENIPPEEMSVPGVVDEK